MQTDYLIVGAGYTGAVLAERIASQLDKKVLVVDRRNHIAGNAFDTIDEAGVLVHLYGPHIFHTNSKKVWDYLSQFTGWRPYEHRVLGVIDGKLVPIPFNFETIDALFPAGLAARYCDALVDRFGFDKKVPILKLREADDPLLTGLADFVYEKVFRGYTVKQWALTPEELGPGVTGRVPVRLNRDDRYFDDRYQAMPAAGYTEMFRRILTHPNITVMLGADGLEVMNTVQYRRAIYTGALDALFDYELGPLAYRSLRFVPERVDREWFQPVGTVNYPNSEDFTRITEWKHLTGQRLPNTSILREYPQAHVPGQNEPYYPIPRDENRAHYERYVALATERYGDRLLFAGRLADYNYYNMDQACARALSLFETTIAPQDADR